MAPSVQANRVALSRRGIRTIVTPVVVDSQNLEALVIALQ